MPITNPIAFYDQAVKYTAVVPRILELNNVAVPTAGQVYQLTGVPSDRAVVAVLQIHPGFSSSGYLSVIVEPVATNQSVFGMVDWGQVGDGVHYYAGGNDLLYPVRTTTLVPTNTGEIFCQRRGSYFGSGSQPRQSNIWTLGYWEGIAL